jgi:hypothetical protein
MRETTEEMLQMIACKPNRAAIPGTTAVSKAVTRAPEPKKKMTNPGMIISDAIKRTPNNPQTNPGCIGIADLLTIYGRPVPSRCQLMFLLFA